MGRNFKNERRHKKMWNPLQQVFLESGCGVTYEFETRPYQEIIASAKLQLVSTIHRNTNT